jgi:diacylglycerol kinase (ATP)
MAAPPNNTGIKRIINAFFFSMHGFAACFRTEEAFRQEVYLAVIMIPLGLWLGGTGLEKVALVGSVMLVLIVEILNTAVERAIDRISFEKHELSKEAKDMGSAAVFLSLVLCGFTWAVVLLPQYL